MTTPWKPLLGLTCASMIFGGAQAQAQVTGSVPVQQFQPTQPAPGAFNHLWGAQTQGHLRPAFGVWVNQGIRPLSVVNQNTDDEVDLVRYQTQVDILAGIGIKDRFQFSVALPVVPYITQGPDGFTVPADVTGFGLGDVRLAGSWHFLGDGSALDMAFVALASLPTGDSTRYLGSEKATFEPRFVAEYHLSDAVNLGANLGFLVRPTADVLSYNDSAIITAGHELTYGLGGAYSVNSSLDVIGEAYGRVGFGEDVDGSNRPLEIDVSARKWLGEGQHAVTFGVGTGLIAGYGSPSLRILAGYAFAPSPRVDTDGDGLFDDDDTCPQEPEDMDGYMDDDGCPDTDNDGDGLLDAQDDCPDKAEDMDSFEDENGCPDPDNDGDGILDGDDSCPGDAEDMDGFEDDDGCPDADNDKDGFLDADDQCPLVAEVINGVDDDDGCPDEGESAVEVTGTQIRILQKVFFKTGSAEIQDKSFGLLNQVALTLKAHTEMTLIQVEGHTDDTGKEDANQILSQNRAESVKAYIVDRGVATERLTAVGFGEGKPLKKGKSRSARAANRRVEFNILELDGKPADGSEKKATKTPPAAKKGDAATTGEGASLSGDMGQFKVLAYFQAGIPTLTPRTQELCKTYAKWMKANPKVHVKLNGFSDDSGTTTEQMASSMARAQAVKACLVAEGVSAKSIKAKGNGAKWPAVENDSDAHRAQNRRVRMMPTTAKGTAMKNLPIELKKDNPQF